MEQLWFWIVCQKTKKKQGSGAGDLRWRALFEQDQARGQRRSQRRCNLTHDQRPQIAMLIRKQQTTPLKQLVASTASNDVNLMTGATAVFSR